ncbi:MAG: alpha/beta fold hydrolase [Candidatus Mycalebacterium zealandia]|nr:MAG: alpha/beta fold hydrolase [Candidatus Mycalebacterium zealandia]
MIENSGADTSVQELITIPTEGGNVNALFYKCENGGYGKEPVIIHVHGFLGNFLEGSQRFLPPILAKAGYSSIAINTRLSNFSLFFGYGIVNSTIPQIDGVIKFLREMGYDKIIISGYSLGGCIAVRYVSSKAGTKEADALSGMIAIATPYSMPDSIKRRWDKWQSSPSYDQIYEEAKEILGSDPMNSTRDRTIIIHKARGDSFSPEHCEIYTYKTWWFLAGPEATSTKTYKQIENIKVPTLLIQGWDDKIVYPNETHDLCQTATEAGNNDVSAFFLNAGHTLEGKEDELGEIITNWLRRRTGN